MTEQVGPLGEEAVRLLAAAQDWFHRNLADPGTARIATGSAECAWCPVCQLIGMLRGDGPGGVLPERLAEVQNALVGLLRAVADATGGPSAAPGGAAGRGARVQRIDLDGEG